MNNEKQIKAIVKALGYAENGGKPDVKNLKAGPTGEMKSIFQFTPDTWKLYSKQIAGKELPMTPDNESNVVYKKVEKWLAEGHNVEEIASMWNAGEQRPEAYKQNWKGTNKKYGVAYDTPAYAAKVKSYADSFIKSDNQGSQQGTTTPNTTTKQPEGNTVRDNIMAMVSKAKEMTQATQPVAQQNSPTQPSAGLLPNLAIKN